MPDLTIDDEGYLLNAEGVRIEQEGGPVKVTGVIKQEKFDQALGERLGKERDKLQKRIDALEQVAQRTPAIEEELKSAKEEKADLEKRLTDAEKDANNKVAGQMATLTKERDTYKANFEAEAAARVRDQVTNLVLSASMDRFVNAAGDVVPKLLTVHKREPVKDDKGNSIAGQHVDLFEMSFKNEKGTEVKEFVPVDKAIEIFASAESNAHYLKPAGRGGAGGGQYGAGGGGSKKGGLTYDSMK